MKKLAAGLGVRVRGLFKEGIPLDLGFNEFALFLGRITQTKETAERREPEIRVKI
ncbi:MAG: hypothetical protein LBG84_05575 [Treponema sp.]|nr:hypothetical protein [Treponema sp.]